MRFCGKLESQYDLGMFLRFRGSTFGYEIRNKLNTSALQFFMGFQTYLECSCDNIRTMFDGIDVDFEGDGRPEIAQRRLIDIVRFHIDILR